MTLVHLHRILIDGGAGGGVREGKGKGSGVYIMQVLLLIDRHSTQFQFQNTIVSYMQISCFFWYNKLNEYVRIVVVVVVVMTQRNLYSQFRISTLKPNANFTHILYRESIQTYVHVYDFLFCFCIEFVVVVVAVIIMQLNNDIIIIIIVIII